MPLKERKSDGSIGKEKVLLMACLGLFVVIAMFFSAYLIYKNHARYIFPPIGAEKGAELGQLGDYFGGVLNPIIGSFTVILLGMIVVYQYKAMESTKKQLDLAKTEYKINILQETARELHKEITLNIHQGIIRCNQGEIHSLIEGFNIASLPTDNGHYCIAHLSQIFVLSECKETNKKILTNAISEMQPHFRLQYDQIQKNLKAFQSVCSELLSLLDDTESVKSYWVINLDEIKSLLHNFPSPS